MYKCPLDAYGLKSCEQNNSLNLSNELGGAYKCFYTSIGLSIKVYYFNPVNINNDYVVIIFYSYIHIILYSLEDSLM